MNCSAAACEFRPVERGLCRTHYRATLRPPRCAPASVVASPALPLLDESESERSEPVDTPLAKLLPVPGEAEMVAGVEGMVHKVARGYFKIVRGGCIEYDDLVAQGRMGALTAARRYDASKGANYLTYATYWIRHFILRLIHDCDRTVRIPVGLQFREGRERALASTETTPVALARRLAVSGGGRAVSLDAPVTDDGDVTLGDRFADPSVSPEELLGELEQRARLEEALRVLNPRLRVVVRLRMQGRTHREVGKALGVSYGSSQNWEREAFEKLRRLMGGAA